jgi:hypothetical protein
LDYVPFSNVLLMSLVSLSNVALWAWLWAACLKNWFAWRPGTGVDIPDPCLENGSSRSRDMYCFLLTIRAAIMA